MPTQEIITEISNLITKLEAVETSESLYVQAVLLTLRGSLKNGSIQSLSGLAVMFGKEQTRQREYSDWMREG